MRLPMSEAQFTETVIQLAQLLGWRVAHFRPAIDRRGQWRTPMSGDKGFPDLVLARDGEVLFVELKTATGRLSLDQKAWGAAIGDEFLVWRPTDMSEIRERLRRL